ncbi:MAG: c-type cytochrome [Gemmatimonadales bacterium]
MRARNLFWASALALLAAGCDWYYNEVPSPDDLMHAIPWFDHMVYAKYVNPYARGDIPRHTVEGAVPVGGGEPDWAAEWAGARTTTADALRNPTVGGDSAAPSGIAVARIPAELTARGDTLYQTFCATCHGQSGKGDGPVGRKLGAPPLISDRARAYTDGYLYSIVRYGRGLMPRYGDKVYDPNDRWAIVNHVRLLQQGAPAPAGAPSTAPGGSN